MNKRTAIALAAGVVVALLIGIASVSLTSTTSAVAEPGSNPSDVRTDERTVTVQRTASPTASMSPAVDDRGVDADDAFDDHGDDGVEHEAGDDDVDDDDAFENEGDDDNSGPGSDNSGPGSDNSGSGSDDSGHDGSDD